MASAGVSSTEQLTVLRWSGACLEPDDDEPAGALLAADSWLVESGRVRGYELHWARFGGWCGELRVPAELVAGFRVAVSAALPRAGRWLPRIELIGSARGRAGAGAHLRLRLRPAQPLVRETRVLVAAPGDPRCHPRWKGPDLPLLFELRAQAIAAGADELLVRDAGGRVLEGALSSLLWWEDEILFTTPDERTLPGITRALLRRIAQQRGVAVRARAPLPESLAGRETWLANAAHGICVVTSWAPDAMAAGAARHAADWQAALDRTARHLDELT